MGHVMGDPARVQMNFLDMIEDLFGEPERAAAERAIRVR